MKQTYTIRLETDLHQKLKDKALETGESLSWLITILVTQALPKRKPKATFTKTTLTAPAHPVPKKEPITREAIINHIVDTLPVIEEDVIPAITPWVIPEPEQYY